MAQPPWIPLVGESVEVVWQGSCLPGAGPALIATAALVGCVALAGLFLGCMLSGACIAVALCGRSSATALFSRRVSYRHVAVQGPMRYKLSPFCWFTGEGRYSSSGNAVCWID
jgi:hypothetical protein